MNTEEKAEHKSFVRKTALEFILEIVAGSVLVSVSMLALFLTVYRIAGRPLEMHEAAALVMAAGLMLVAGSVLYYFMTKTGKEK